MGVDRDEFSGDGPNSFDGDCAERQETLETSVSCTLARYEGGKSQLPN
jgi:hypothetical protein